jgi:hypothetical protein
VEKQLLEINGLLLPKYLIILVFEKKKKGNATQMDLHEMFYPPLFGPLGFVLWWGVKLHILIHIIDQKQKEGNVVVL